MTAEQIRRARGLVMAAGRRLQNIVPAKWDDTVPLCVKVERDEILALLLKALEDMPEPKDPPYMNVGVTA